MDAILDKTVPQLAVKHCKIGKDQSESCFSPVCTQLTLNTPRLGRLKILSPDVINKKFKEILLPKIPSPKTSETAEKTSIGRSEKIQNLTLSKFGTQDRVDDKNDTVQNFTDEVLSDSVAISTILHDSLCRVQIIPSLNTDERKIGTGNKCVQFFYGDRNNSPAFLPVYVNTDAQVRAVAALVKEKASFFNWKSGGCRGEIPKHTSGLAMALFTLQNDVLNHIRHCFTKKGMKEFKVGKRKNNYPKNRKKRTSNKINQGEKLADGETSIKVNRTDNEPETDAGQAAMPMGPLNYHGINESYIKEENAVFIKEKNSDNIREKNYNTNDYFVKEGYLKADIGKSYPQYTHKVEMSKVDLMEVKDIKIESFDLALEKDPLNCSFATICESVDSVQSFTQHKMKRKYPGFGEIKTKKNYPGFGQVLSGKVEKARESGKRNCKQMKPLVQNNKGIAEIPKSNKRCLDFQQNVDGNLKKIDEGLELSFQFPQSRELDNVHQSNSPPENENTKQLMLTAKKLEFSSKLSSLSSQSAKKPQKKPTASTASKLPLTPPLFSSSKTQAGQQTKAKPSNEANGIYAGKKVATQSYNENDMNESDLNDNATGNLLDGVVMAISGFENPLRSEIRCKAISMGAQYRSAWTNDCTHLVCAFLYTPKYQQAIGKGKIVAKDWIEDCHEMGKKLDCEDYILLEEEQEDQDEDEDDKEIEDIVIKLEPSTYY